MKKILMIVIPIILIAIASGLLWWYDYTRIIEEPIDIVKNGQKAFSVVDNGDNVVFTIYGEEITRIVTTFYFKDGVINRAICQKVYKNKAWARGSLSEDFPKWYNRKLNGNVIIGDVDNSIGEPQEGFAKMLIDTYSLSWIRVE